MFMHQESSIARWQKWLWSVLLEVTFVAALFPITIVVSEISRHRSGWHLNVIYGKGLERSLAKGVSKDWNDVATNYRPAWVLYRTPISLYHLAAIMMCLGPVCCVAGRYRWHRNLCFALLGIVTLGVVGFHLWAQNPLTQVNHIAKWPFLLFPASLLFLVWVLVLIAERRQPRSTNEPLPLSGEQAG